MNIFTSLRSGNQDCIVPSSNLIIDFDHTFVECDSVAQVVNLSVANMPNGKALFNDFYKELEKGMDGDAQTYVDSWSRLAGLKIHKDHVQQLIEKLPRYVTKSIERNKKFFEENREHIYIISGGIKEMIIPVVTQYGIKAENVYANDFVYNMEGYVTGVDMTNCLIRENGKAEVVQKLKISGKIVVIGDGHNDYEIKLCGIDCTFIAFTENMSRPTVVTGADFEAKSFEEVLAILQKKTF